MDGRIFQIIELLSQTLGDSWSVERMAAVAAVSPSRFKHLFKKMVGMPPMAYLLKIRLEAAYDYLTDPLCFLQIQEIRIKCGLKDDSHFTHDFKKKYGLTPTQCREQAAEIYQANFKNRQK